MRGRLVREGEESRSPSPLGGLPGRHVVLQIGAHTDLAAIGDVPANVEVHRWVPQLSVLKQADAFITHAGAGGSQEGLATGTPMVAVPQAVDQYGNADMLQALGVAKHLPMEEADAKTLRAAVLALVDDPEVAARVFNCCGFRLSRLGDAAYQLRG